MHDLAVRVRAEIPADSSPRQIWGHTKIVFDSLNVRMREITDEMRGLGAAIVADSTPAASIEYLGKFVLVRNYGSGVDVLKICVQTGATTYSWYTVTIAP